MGNSFWIGIVVASLTLIIGTLTSFTIGRMRIRQGWMLTNAALMTYVIPMSFLAIPFYGIMGKYGHDGQSAGGDSGGSHLRHALRDLHLPAVQRVDPL